MADYTNFIVNFAIEIFYYKSMEQLIGRKIEQRKLLGYSKSKKAEFVAVYGRRRVGKTFLIDACFGGKYDFYMSGVVEGKLGDELYAFNSALAEYGCQASPAQNWKEAFSNLKALLQPKLKQKRVLVFIDELPCLDTPRSGFVQAFDAFWNSWASKHASIMLIVCGSATSWMIENIVDSHGGLHNRITHELHLRPFSLYETKEYLETSGFKWDKLTIAQCYMTMGGVPYYLGMLDPAMSLAQNLDKLYFEHDGPLRREYERLFHAIFRRPEKYVRVIECLAKSRSGLTRSEIMASAKIKSGDEMSRSLRNLEYCDFLRSFSTNSRPNAINNRAYQITDFFVLFYLKFCKKPTTDPQWWSHNLGKSVQNEWFGIMFEILSVLHISQIKMALGIDGIYTEYASWRSKKDAKAQIDLLIDRSDNMVTICEMKYSKGDYALDKEESEKLERRTEVYEAEVRPNKGLQLALVTTRGLKQNKYSSLISRTVTLADLFQRQRE